MNLGNRKTIYRLLATIAYKHLDGDEDKLIAIRKLAAAGATAQEMAEATGLSKCQVAYRIRKHSLVWNRPRSGKCQTSDDGDYTDTAIGTPSWRPKAKPEASK